MHIDPHRLKIQAKLGIIFGTMVVCSLLLAKIFGPEELMHGLKYSLVFWMWPGLAGLCFALIHWLDTLHLPPPDDDDWRRGWSDEDLSPRPPRGPRARRTLCRRSCTPAHRPVTVIR